VTDVWGQGISFQAGVGYSGGGRTEFGLEYSRSVLALNQDSVLARVGRSEDGLELEGGAIALTTAMAYIKMNLIRTDVGFSPYVIFGGGLFQFKPSEIDVIGEQANLVDTEEDDFLFEETESVAGFTLGFGLDLRLRSPLYLFVEARGIFGVTELEGTMVTPLRIGLVLR